MTTEIGTHPLVSGIDQLGFGEGALVVYETSTPLVRLNNQCVMAVEAFGKGLLIVSGDQQFIDDHGLVSYPPNEGDNLILADRLARIP